MRSIFKPTPADLALTCPANCKASLDDYLGGLMLHYNAPGDLTTMLTTMHTDGPRPGDLVPIEPERIWVVGWMLQYIPARPCWLVDGSNPLASPCPFNTRRATATLTNPPVAPTTVRLIAPNLVQCARFYMLMHDYPGFHWSFNAYASGSRRPGGRSIPPSGGSARCGAVPRRRSPSMRRRPKTGRCMGGSRRIHRHRRR